MPGTCSHLVGITEEQQRNCCVAEAVDREIRMKWSDHEALVLEHYLRGWKHPDDVRCSILDWEKYE
jgi:hypothetical protein